MNEGMSEGMHEGINEGMNEGMNEGVNEGMNGGMSVGMKLGMSEGMTACRSSSKVVRSFKPAYGPGSHSSTIRRNCRQTSPMCSFEQP